MMILKQFPSTSTVLKPSSFYLQVILHKLFKRNVSTTQPKSATSGKLVAIDQLPGGRRKISLNDPKTRNSMSLQMMTDLIEAIETDKSNVELRTITIGAYGPVFSAGHDLKQLAGCGIDGQREIFSKCTELMLAIRKSEVPVIGVVNGLAAAAGCQLVCACDFVICTESSKFSTPGANFGVFCSTPGVEVGRVVNRTTAAYMLLTGLPISAEDALKAGLVAKIVPENQLDDTVEKICESIQHKSRAVLKLGKSFFYKQIQMNYEDALKSGEQIMVKNLSFGDAKEGLSSFKAKRKPNWTHE